MQTLPGSGFASLWYFRREPQDTGTPLQCCPSVHHPLVPSGGDNPLLPCPQSPGKQLLLPPELLPHLVSIINSTGRDKGSLQEGRGVLDEGLAGGEGGGLQGWDEGQAEAPAQELCWAGGAQLPITTSL